MENMLQVIWINQEHSGPYQICMKLSDFCKVNWPNHCDWVIRHMVLDRSALCSHHNDWVGSVKNQSVCVVTMIMLDWLSINWLCVVYTTKPIDARPIGLVYPTTMIGLDRSRTNWSVLP